MDKHCTILCCVPAPQIRLNSRPLCTIHHTNDFIVLYCIDDGLLADFDRVAPLGANFSHIVFTMDNVAGVLRQLQANSSCGRDGFPHILLKKLAVEFINTVYK